MSKRKTHLYNIYSNPLPLNLSKLSISNIIFGFNIKQDEIYVIYEDDVFKSADEKSTQRLWFNGFFGKGCLSRSEPSFVDRTRRRLMLDQDDDDSSLTSEEITKLRRDERLNFKKQRLELEKLENEYKLTNNLSKLDEIEKAKNELTKNQKLKKPIIELYKEHSKPLIPRLEDEILFNDTSYLESIEYLQLLPSEVLFLSLINRITVMYLNGNPMSFKDLLKIVIPSLDKSCKEFVEFVTYYHYKSLGWCVKSGVKFSTDYILYEKGPVFNHANFAILIMEPGLQLDWIQMSSYNRVVSGVKKQLIIMYVETDDLDDQLIEEFSELLSNNDEEIDDEDDKDDDGKIIRESFIEILQKIGVNEFGINMWSSTRNRE